MKFSLIILIFNIYFMVSSAFMFSPYLMRQYYHPSSYNQPVENQESERNQYYQNLYEKVMNEYDDTEDINDEDFFEIQNKNYYDEYSFKTNWADSWEDSDIRPPGWFTLPTRLVEK